MSDFYTKLAKTSLRLIADKGRDVSIIRTTQGEYEPGTGFVSSSTKTNKAKAVFTNYTKQDIDGTLIITDDKQCLIAADALDFEPSTGDKIKEATTEWTIVRADVVKPGSVALLYKIQVRR